MTGPPCRRGCGSTVPLAGVTCARCVRQDEERTPRTQAGRDAVRAAIERRVAAEEAHREQQRAGLAKARAALAAAKAAQPDQGGLW